MFKIISFLLFLIVGYMFSFGQPGGGGGLIVRDGSLIHPAQPASDVSNMTRFGNVNILSSTGTASYSIPIYKINIDELEIPIQLNYVSSGFRPADAGSYLGLHWSLGGIGSVNRSVRGIDDENGYLINSINQQYVDSINSDNSYTTQDLLSVMNLGGDFDISQDSYSVDFLHLSNKLFINSVKQFEFSNKTDNKLWYKLTPVGSYNSISFFVRDARGNTYEFSETESNISIITGGGVRNASGGIVTWKIKRIITSTGKVVEFNYTSYTYNFDTPGTDQYTTKSYGYIPDIGAPTPCGCSESSSMSIGRVRNTYHVKLLTSIVTDGETVELQYQDDPGADYFKKKLSAISVKDKRNALVRKFDFGYEYYRGSNRFKLTSFKQIDVLDNTKEMEYKFTYYETNNIPATDTRSVDDFFYYNGFSNNHLIYTNEPGLGTNVADRRVSTQFARITLLKDVFYPTGGSTTWEYESNRGESIADFGSGLRIQKNIDKDLNGNTVGVKEYVYRGYSGNVSLLVNNTPNGAIMESTQLDEQCRRFVYTSNNLNGSIFSTIPTTDYFYYREIDVLNTAPNDTIKTTYGYTRFSTMDGDTKIENAFVKYFKYDAQYVLQKSTTYHYSFKGLDDYPLSVFQFAAFPGKLEARRLYGGTVVNCQLYYRGIAQSLPRFQSHLSLSNQIDSVFENGILNVNVTDYKYGNLVEQPSALITKNSKNEILKTSFLYPSDFVGIEIADTMNKRNLLYYPLQKIDSNISLSKELLRIKNSYRYYSSFDFVKLDSVFTSYEGAPSVLELAVNKYDSYGNPLELYDKNGIITSFVWSYKSKLLAAKIVGEGYDNVISQAGIDISLISNPITSYNSVSSELNKISNHYANNPDVFVSTYSQIPFIGVKQTTNINQLSDYSYYDGFGRLVARKDNNGNLLDKFCYSYNNQSVNCNVNETEIWTKIPGVERCKLDAFGENSGEIEEQQFQSNFNRNNYDSTRWSVVRIDEQACPVPNPCLRYPIYIGRVLPNLHIVITSCSTNQTQYIRVADLGIPDGTTYNVWSKSTPSLTVILP